MHENARQIQLDLEIYIHIGTIDGRWLPQSKMTIPNLIQTGTLSIGQFFVLHGLFKTLQNTFYTAQRQYHVWAIIVKVPQLAIVTLMLMRPPEVFLLQHLILLEVWV